MQIYSYWSALIRGSGFIFDRANSPFHGSKCSHTNTLTDHVFYFQSSMWGLSSEQTNKYSLSLFGLAIWICRMNSDLNAFNAEAESGCGAECLSPLHVSRFEDSLLGPLLLSGGSRVHCHHLVIHVLSKARSLSGFYQLFLQVSPWEKKEHTVTKTWKGDGTNRGT